MKDDTDTQYAARWLLEQGYDEITLLGALGGARLEHTLANLATGLYLAKTASASCWPMSAAAALSGPRAVRWCWHTTTEVSLLFPMEGTLTGVCLRACTTRSRTPFYRRVSPRRQQ